MLNKIFIEEEFILLQDLAARLPYGVIVSTPEGIGFLCEINLTIFGVVLGVNIKATERKKFNLLDCKPFLRSLSSMTKEEFKQCSERKDFELFSWLTQNFFDYRGLITSGQAVLVTKLNNPYLQDTDL